MRRGTTPGGYRLLWMACRLPAVGDQAAGQRTARAGLDVNEPKRFAPVHAVQRYVRCWMETGSSQRWVKMTRMTPMDIVLAVNVLG
jgi:hypothetical protein